MTLEQAIQEKINSLVWRWDCLMDEERPDTDSQAEAVRFYNAVFGAEHAAVLARLLRRKARRHMGPRPQIRVQVKLNPPTVSDIHEAETPEDLVRRQRQREAE
jgi:hypothetical protein